MSERNELKWKDGKFIRIIIKNIFDISHCDKNDDDNEIDEMMSMASTSSLMMLW